MQGYKILLQVDNFNKNKLGQSCSKLRTNLDLLVNKLINSTRKLRILRVRESADEPSKNIPSKRPMDPLRVLRFRVGKYPKVFKSAQKHSEVFKNTQKYSKDPKNSKVPQST